MLIRKRENIVQALVPETRNLLEQVDIDLVLAFFRQMNLADQGNILSRYSPGSG